MESIYLCVGFVPARARAQSDASALGLFHQNHRPAPGPLNTPDRRNLKLIKNIGLFLVCQHSSITFINVNKTRGAPEQSSNAHRGIPLPPRLRSIRLQIGPADIADSDGCTQARHTFVDNDLRRVASFMESSKVKLPVILIKHRIRY